MISSINIRKLRTVYHRRYGEERREYRERRKRATYVKKHTKIHEMFLAESSHGVNVKKPESELHSGSEQQGEEPSCADQPPPTTLWIEMRSHTAHVYAWGEED